MRLIPARSALVAALAAVAVLAVASPASADISITAVDVQLSTTQAGAHPDLSIRTSFGGDMTTQIGGPGFNPIADSPSIYQIHLPPGLNGNPLAAPTCTMAQFQTDACPPQTLVGTATQSIFILLARPGEQNRDLPGFIYNLETDDPDQAALLGVRTIGGVDPGTGQPITASRVPFALTVSPVDYGLDSINLERLTAVSRTAGPIFITALALRLSGRVAGGFFTSNPTACTPIRVSVSATSNVGETATGESAPFTPTDCGTLPFDVGLGLGLSTTETDRPVEATVSVTAPGSDDPRRQSALLESTVVLPEGMTVNPALAVGLEACTDEQFNAADRTTAAACPAASQIGTVRFVSPLFLQTFEGPVYYGTRTPTAFNRLFVDVAIPGVRLKLTGRVTLNEANGQVTTVFQDLPQLPFTSFDLTFQGGPRSVLATPVACGTYTATSRHIPYARLTDPTPPDATPTATFTTTFEGTGPPCAIPFGPWFTSAVSNDRSGARTQYTLRFGRPDRHQRIARVTFRLPAGLIGDLALDGLTQCSLDTAARGACPASSRVGNATVEVGTGPAPASVAGEVFLTAARVAGDPAGLSVVIDAAIGPVDLGDVIVPVRLQLRTNGGLTATAELPQFDEGVPISPRLAIIAITREGFMRNPTSCGKRRHSGDFVSAGGAFARTFAAFTLSDCRALGFSPQIRARLGARGMTRTRSHPPLVTRITQPDGQSGIRRARVLLPRALATNLRAIEAACSQADFDAGRCSDDARGGRAIAVSPFVDEPLRGPVYLVRRERGRLPKLVAQLGGPLRIDVTGLPKVGRRGKIATIFKDLPDVPVTSFTLRLRGGRLGWLQATENLCARGLALPAGFRAWNGELTRRRPPIAVRGCG
jgi:hypothetical protein